MIDTHFHLWQRAPSWVLKHSRLDKSFYLKELISLYEGLLKGCIYIENGSNDFKKELDFIALQAEKSLVLGEISSELDFSCLGFRELLHTPLAKITRCLEKDFLQRLDLLYEKKLVFEACVKEGVLAKLELCARQSKATIVLNHFANPDFTRLLAYEEQLKSIAKNENVFCKLSAMDIMDENTDKRLIAKLCDIALLAFGEDRLIFGSNFPVSKLKPLKLAKIIKKTLGERISTKLFSKNPFLIYNINKG